MFVLVFGASASALQAKEKYAVLIGINDYPAGISKLRGCVNDAKNIHNALTTNFGFKTSNVSTLFDSAATRDGIINEIRKYQQKAGPGDLFVLAFSGHGTIFPDSKSEEQDETTAFEVIYYGQVAYAKDRYDVSIVPYDARSASSGKPWRNLILDDELFNLFSGFTNKGAGVILISDSCHSGSIARGFDDPDNAVRFAPLEEAIGVTLDDIEEPADTRSIGTRDMKGLYLSIGASRDEQTSLDFRNEEGSMAGLFTDVFIKTLKRLQNAGKRQPTYQEVYSLVAPEVSRIGRQKNNPQDPQLDARFYKGRLDTPIFGFMTAGSQLLRLVVKITDAQGNPLPGCSFGVFKAGAGPTPGREIRSSDLIVMGKSNEKGLYDSNIGALLVEPGTYTIKIVKEGYRTFTGDREITEGGQPGIAVLSFKLEKE
jgi:hypothetical protein